MEETKSFGESDGAKPADKTKTIRQLDEYQRAKQNYLLCMRAYDAHKKYLAEKKRCNDFYLNEQWDADDLQKLKEENRPALTINLILSTINIIFGEQIGRRVDIQFKAAKGASEQSAIALTKLTQAIADANMLHWKETQVFQDGIIEDRGYFDVRMNFDENIFGEIEINSVDPGDIIPDSDGVEYDPRTWADVFRLRWMGFDEIESTYGKAARKKLDSVVALGTHFGKESIQRQRNMYSQKEDNPADASYDDADSDKFIYKVLVIERQYYKNTVIYQLVDPADGSLKSLPPGTKEKDAALLAQRWGVRYRKTIQKRVRWCVSADQFLMHDDWSIYRTFTVIPYFPYFRRGRPMGAVRPLLSPQEQYNKLSSQELHIVNTTANSGYITELGALANMTPEQLKTEGAKTGAVITLNPGKMGAFTKIKPNQIPTGIDRITEKSAIRLKEISGINDSMRGTEGAEVSGVAMDKKEMRGQIQMQVPLDNLAKTRHLLALKILELVKDFYTNERIIYYTNDLDPEQKTEQIAINQIQEDGSILNDVTRGCYNIVIGTLPVRDNFRDTQFAESLALRNVGVGIPDYRIVQYSNLAHKHEIAAEVKALSGLGPKTPEQQEIEERQLLASIENLEAEVDKKIAAAQELQSRADLNVAKADEVRMSPASAREALEFEDVKDRRTVQLRERLALMQSLNKLDVTELASRLRRPPGDKK